MKKHQKFFQADKQKHDHQIFWLKVYLKKMLLHSLYYLQPGLKLEIDHKQTMLLQQQSRER